ncbi:hypothetical protein HHK36_028953 [Tetracentron sinense]|uniref:SLH domain-containing protein n=1 Tax=Tetracentron sinense TaxID=13715 RepID=A0A834YIB4_TETSI|nr:hypothetical protein HHK36_028953 [Tetracentron sinense]
MASLLTTSPNSFQLRLGFKLRKSSLVFIRTHVRTVDRRIRSFSAAGSAGSEGDGTERRNSGNSWSNSDSSNDALSGWFSEDSGDSQKKRGFGGIVGAGVAVVLLAAGIAFASLSLSKRNTSGLKKQMEPLTAQQEQSLASDEQNDKDEQIRNEGNIVVLDEGSLQNDCNPESKTSIDADHFSSPEITEATSESVPGNNINAGASLIQNDEYTSNGVDAINNAFSQEDLKVRSDDISVASNTSPSSPKMLESDIVDGSSDASSFKGSDGFHTAGTPESTIELEENLFMVNLTNPSFSDANSTNLDTDHEEGISGSRKIENSNLPLDSSSSSIAQIPSEPLAFDSPVSLHPDVIVETQVVSSTKEDFHLSITRQVQTESISLAQEAHTLSENGSSGTTSMSALANPNANEPDRNGDSEIDKSRSLFEWPICEKAFSSAGIPAPSLLSVALQVPPGKVIEADVQPSDLCTRREYARWLVTASSALSRNTVSKVYPAMYIENVTELAFDDITPEDPDFAVIQGLAEAGLIASKLSRRDILSSLDEEQNSFFFSPESPLSRQDLVSWKMALDERQLPEVDRKILYQRSGFIDIDKINPDAWPALVADISAGDQGIIPLAFGYTRLFQPDKPVTKAQAAIALATGEAADIVSEEFTRIEAESMAETVVAAHSALVAQVEKDVNASFEKELAMEREKIDAVEKMAEEARQELETLRAEREEENNALMKGRAAVEMEMEVLSRLRHEVEEQLQSLMGNKMEISFERERINRLRKETESEHQTIARLQYELEVERKALSMARAWAEDEAKRAREQAKALEEARDRWERHGIKVVVDDDLHEDTSIGVTWLNAGKQSVNETVSRAENLVDKLKAMAIEVRGNARTVIEKIIQKIVHLISVLKEWASEVAGRARELQDAAILKASGSVQELQQSAAGFSLTLKEGARRIAGDCKEGVGKITHKFKT